MNQTKKRFNVLRGAFLVTLILLVIQYVFGMLVNLFVQFPNTLPGGNAWNWSFNHTYVIPIHFMIGTLLIIVSLIALVLSIRTRHVPEILAAVFGLAMIVYAWLGGEVFLAYGQQNTASLQMALGFIGAVIAYGVGLYIVRPAHRSSKNTLQEDNVRERETSLILQ